LYFTLFHEEDARSNNPRVHSLSVHNTGMWRGRQEIHTEFWKAPIWQTIKQMLVKTKAVDCGTREVHRSGSGCAPWWDLLFLDTEFSASAARHLFTEHMIEYIFFLLS